MNVRTARVAAAGLALFAATAAAAPPSGTFLYRYTDAQGVLHLETSLPPAAAQYGYEVLDRKTLKLLRTVEAPPSAEELAERQAQDQARQAQEAAAAAAQAAQAAAQEQARMEQARRDRALLDSYTTVADLERTRDDQLAALAAIATGAQATIARLEKNLAQMTAQRATYEKDGRAVPAPLQKNIADVEGKLGRQRGLLTSNAARRAELETRFAADIARYRELKGDTLAPPPAVLAPTAGTAPAP